MLFSLSFFPFSESSNIPGLRTDSVKSDVEVSVPRANDHDYVSTSDQKSTEEKLQECWISNTNYY